MFYLYPKRFNENLLMFGGEPYVSVLRVLDFQNKKIIRSMFDNHPCFKLTDFINTIYLV